MIEYYIIRKGEHYSDESRPSLTFKSKLEFTVRFNETVRYLGEQNSDINKLYGFSDCWSLHHKNSIRIGWRWNSNLRLIELYGYTYVKGERIIGGVIDSICINELVKITIKINYDRYLINIDRGEKGINYIMKRKPSSIFSLRYRLFPYYGGDSVAPKSISIEINEL